MKKILAVLLSLSLLSSLSACGGQTSTTENKSNNASQVEQSSNSEADNSAPSAEGSANTPADSSESAKENSTPVDTSAASSDYSYDINLDGVTNLDELEDRIDEDLTKGIEYLNSQW